MTARPKIPALLCAALLWFGLAFSLALAEEAPRLNGVALVIGQSGYRHLPPLANTGNDARALTQLLTGLGFEARTVADRDAVKLKRDLERFAEDAEGADVALIYYSGHGIEAGGENYLLPVDADLAALEDAGERLAPLSATIEKIRQSVPVTILLIDACRTNPFPPGTLVKTEAASPGVPIGATGLGAPKGAVPVEATAATDTLGIVIGYAAEPGHAALDGAEGANSPYAAALIRHLSAMKGAEFGTVMRMVTEEVYLKTQGRQRPWVNESLRRLLYFGATPEEPKGEEALITGERRQLLLTIAALPDAGRLQVETIAKDGGVPLDALYGVLRALGEKQMPQDPEALEKLLRDQAHKLKTMMAERKALEADDPEITRLAAAADRAIAEGAIATARQFLDQAVTRVAATQGAVDRAEAKLKAKRLADAAVYARRASAGGLAFDYFAASQDYEAAFDLAQKWDVDKAWEYKMNAASMLQHQGYETGDKQTLQKSIEVYRQAFALTSRAGDPQGQWAATQYDLGNALLELAILEDSATRYEEAAQAFRATLSVYDHKTKPQDWAAVQHGLGTVLHTLGRKEQGTAKLHQAVAAYRAALTERTREGFPEGWGQTMQNLGGALYAIGTRENSEVFLNEAAAALRAALEVRRSDLAPIDWAVTQYNLGLVLKSLGKLKSDPALFDDAASVFRSALDATPQTRFPVYWTKIDKALREASRLSDDARRKQAASRNALSGDLRARDPDAWASAKYKVGTGLLALGGNDLTAERLEEAIAAFHVVLEIRSRETDPEGWAEAQYNLGRALYKLGRRESGTARLEEAVKAFRESLSVQRQESTTLAWAKTQDELGRVLQIIGYRKNSTADLEEAIRSTQSAIEGFQIAGTPVDLQGAERQLGLTRSLLDLARKP
ncbi:caspase family protein [Taklimakanibacter deserti]|uniref:caspase family protein n=1 Tax=Taklimakanibacter deserti TaxID=2267839 RepID=UPI0013C4459E